MTLRAPVGDVSAQFALDANALGALKQQAKSDPKQALSAAATQFEALFMQMLLKSMRDALPQDGPLASETSKTYTAMFDQQVAQQLSKKGVGIANMLVKQLSTAMSAKNVPEGATDGSAAKALPTTSAAKPAAPLKITRTEAVERSTASIGSTVQGFIDKLRPYAEAVAQKMGIPADYLIAQAGLETGWGRSHPRAADGTTSYNLFGIKATAAWKGATAQAATTEYAAGRMEKTTATFRAYASYGDSLHDFARLLQKSRRYANALANTHDARKYASSLQEAGYATDPRYAEKLTRAIQTVARYGAPPASATQVVAAPVDNSSSRV